MRHVIEVGVPVVVKVGSSSLSTDEGGIDDAALEGVVGDVASLVEHGYPPILVTSGAIAAGLPAMGLTQRPSDIVDLQVAAAVGQTMLMERYAAAFSGHGLTIGQVLLTKDVLGNRTQYLNARASLLRMLALGVIPIVNENDTVVVDEVRAGDNDQLAAIASHLVTAGMLVILTDTPGLFTDDPRFTDGAELLSAVQHNDMVLDRIRGAPEGQGFGSGGVASKVTAARMAAFSGIPTVIGPSGRVGTVADAVGGLEVGTWVDPRPKKLAARKLWIAFGLVSCGEVIVDDGAINAMAGEGGSLLAVGVRGVDGEFSRRDAVEVVDEDQGLVAKGIVRVSSDELRDLAGEHSSLLGGEVIHRDDLVVLC